VKGSNQHISSIRTGTF